MQNTTRKHVIGGFRAVLQNHRLWFLMFGAGAVILRFLFVGYFFATTPDSFVYGNFAKTWLQHHVYGVTTPHGIVAADFRLPGYPAYLALCFKIAGMEHYGAACVGQIFVDLATCFVVAALAFRMAGERAAKWAFALTALCPFLANYASTALTETWSIFFTAVALLFATYGAEALRDHRLSLRAWAWSGLAIGGGLLLRPDGGMLLIAIMLWLGWQFVFTHPSKQSQGGAPGGSPPRRRVFAAGVLVGVFTFVPLIPWTVRNAVTLHQFHPLPDKTAAAPGEYYPAGFMRWMRTWIVDYASLEDIGFRAGSDEIPFDRLPNRAFDSAEQRRQTKQVFEIYNDTLDITPAIDAKFATLARERIRRNPLRYYIELPVLCALDMWLRPRTEMLPVDSHWWEYENDPHDSTIGVAMGLLNLVLLVVAAWSLRNARAMRYLGLLMTFVVVRTALLVVFTPPEPRYVLECYPVVLAMAGAFRLRRVTVEPSAPAVFETTQ